MVFEEVEASLDRLYAHLTVCVQAGQRCLQTRHTPLYELRLSRQVIIYNTSRWWYERRDTSRGEQGTK